MRLRRRRDKTIIRRLVITRTRGSFTILWTIYIIIVIAVLLVQRQRSVSARFARIGRRPGPGYRVGKHAERDRVITDNACPDETAAAAAAASMIQRHHDARRTAAVRA